jgi:hypothetical protein
MKENILYILFIDMNKIKAELKYKANSFEIIKEGDYVVCSVSNKKIPLKNLNYWNVDLQEAYFSPLEAQQRFEQFKNKK